MTQFDPNTRQPVYPGSSQWHQLDQENVVRGASQQGAAPPDFVARGIPDHLLVRVYRWIVGLAVVAAVVTLVMGSVGAAAFFLVLAFLIVFVKFGFMYYARKFFGGDQDR